MSPLITKGQIVKSILVLVAMDIEAESVLNKHPEFTKKNSLSEQAFPSWELNLGDRRIVMAKTGIGIVNAGIATFLAIKDSKFDAIILLGVAGALRSDLKIGQFVLAKSILQHDSIFSGTHGNQLMAPGEPFLSIPEDHRSIPHWKTDEDLNRWIKTSFPSIVEGTFLSGSEFVGNVARKRFLSTLAENTVAVDMEAAGIAMLAKKMDVPFTTIKTIADRLEPQLRNSEKLSNLNQNFIAPVNKDQSIELDYITFARIAANQAAEFISLLFI